MAARSLREMLDERIVVFDGAIGTMLQERLGGAPVPDVVNLECPDLVSEIHAAYVAAGSDIIQTNTFGATAIKLESVGLADKAAEINAKAAKLARSAAGRDTLVAADIGPTGKIVEPLGELSFWDAYEAFKDQVTVLAEGGVDLIVIETMSDLKEAKAALLAAREAADLPVLVLMTFDEQFTTPTGTDPATAANVLASMGAFAVGANCSTGPRLMVEVVGRMAEVTSAPILVRPNAGIPEIVDGKTVFRLGPHPFAEHCERLVTAGAAMVGGCCGTTPAHTEALIERLRGVRPVARNVPRALRLSSRMRTVEIGHAFPFAVVGERINPTNRDDLTKDMLDGRTEIILREGHAQVEAGAHVLDVNVGVPGCDEVPVMTRAALALEHAITAPLSIDSTDAGVLESAAVALAGKPLLNSVTGGQKKLHAVLPVAARFGTGVVCLAMDEHGIRPTAEERVNVLRHIVSAAEAHGVSCENLILDCLTLAVSAEQERVPATLRGVEMVCAELGLPTILGVSNVSYGLPDRGVLNAAFLAMAMERGLDAAIMNPLDESMMATARASSVLTLRDQDSAAYIREHARRRRKPEPEAAAAAPGGIEERLAQAVFDGDRDGIASLVDDALAAGKKPRDINDGTLIPALEEVGRRFERKECFLPQMMLSAETVQAAFEKLKPLFPKADASASKGTVVLATVAGDIHDIGKNILACVIENHGYAVIDLGKNVSSERIVQAAREHDADIVGLSALMTTTVTQMPAVIDALKDEGVGCRVMVGGAVVTQRFAESIGADGYAKDAATAVDLLKRLLEE